MILPRVLDWRSRLVPWAEGLRGEPYEWGLTDCGKIACAALAEMFGQDIAALPPYTTAAEAVRVLSAAGGAGGIMQRLGAEPVTSMFLQSGAIVVDPDKGDEHFPGIYVYVEPILITSHLETGVEWYEREGVLGANAVVFNLWEALLPDG
ncbi:hypothetical protein LCGC14_0691670 [marine sediment metagenome]|uniref:DUF6950 domain-containing protein n=1 Tax=marine sediment metagenome TaxID=412755 RepID=A0A0F9TT61_9ZZZZ